MNMKLFFTSALAVLIVFSAHAKGSDSNSVYFAAAEQGDVATLQQFFATNLNAASLVNDLLRTAVLGGQKDTTELLIQRGADVNHKGSFDLTPLAHLAMYGSSDDAKCAEVAKVLISHGAQIEPVDGYHGTPILHAVESKKSQLARVLLEHGANVVSRYDGVRSGMTLLHMAVVHKDKDMVAVLLEFKAPMNAVDRDGSTPLAIAEGRDESEIADLLRAANPDAANAGHNYSPLPDQEVFRALAQRIAKGDDAAYDELIALTSKLYKEIKDYQAERGRAGALGVRMRLVVDVLGEEAGKGSQPALEVLKKSLRPPNMFTSFVPDALAVAAAGGNREALDMLIHYGDWDILESSAWFALAKPVAANVAPAVDESVKWLQKIHSSDRDGGMVMDITNALASAAAKGNQTAKEALDKFVASAPPPRIEIQTPAYHPPARDPNVPARWGYLIGDSALLDRVLASPGLLEVLDENHETALTAMIKARNAPLARTLLEHGAKIPPPRLPPPQYQGMGEEFKQGNFDRTPMLWAVRRGDKEMVALLLEFKAPLDAVDQDGRMPLHYAVERQDKEMVKLLLDAKAPVDAAAKDGATPLILAETAENKDLTAMLLQAGATPLSDKPFPTREELCAMAQRICDGDANALDDLARASAEFYRGVDGRSPQARRLVGGRRMSAVSDILANAAAKGNDSAFQALKKCLMEKNSLKGLAPGALGKVAAAGNVEALDILLDYRQWTTLENSACFALQAPAMANQERAVDFFIAIATDPAAPKKYFYGVGWMVKEVLQNASSHGNQKAADVLDKFTAAFEQAKN
jgi:ankyrin repeat protein